MKKAITITSSFIDRFEMKPINISISEYKNIVLRDISYLLSTTSHFKQEDMSENLDRVNLSVLAYGLNTYLGCNYQSHKNGIINNVKNAILKYEPRIRAETLELIEHESDGINFNLLIKGELIAPGCSENINLSLSIDIETGHSTVNSQ